MSYHIRTQDLRKGGRSLTRENYTDILRIIANSVRPLSTYDIKKEMEKHTLEENQSPSVYEMIKKLVPSKVESDFIEFLFNANRIPRDPVIEKNVAKVLNNRFRLSWTVEQNEAKNIDRIEITRISNTSISIQNSTRNSLIILNLDSDNTRGILKIIRDDGHSDTFPLVYYGNEKYGEKIENVYLHNSMISRETRPRSKHLDRLYRLPAIDYLDKSLDPEYASIVAINQVRISELWNLDDQRFAKSKLPVSTHGYFLTNEEKEELDRLLLENSIMEDDKRKWRYELNIRGLILYLLGEIELEERKGSRKRDKGRKHNKRISKVLQHLCKVGKGKFRFLRFYYGFRELYEKAENKDDFPEYYEVELLKKVALELRNLVHSADVETVRLLDNTTFFWRSYLLSYSSA